MPLFFKRFLREGGSMAVIAVVQFATKKDLAENLQEAEQFIQQAVNKKAQCVIFPEEFITLGMTHNAKLLLAEPYLSGPLQAKMAEWAKRYNIWIVGGTLPIQSDDAKKYYSSCIIWDNQGHTVGRYDKIHLFDVEVNDKESFSESSYVQAGEKITLITTPFGKMGIAICYDIRFPELFRHFALQGADMIVLPSAFTQPTGKVHWEILLRARAIENLCYVIAPDQVGMRLSGHGTYGHSMVVDPWGEIIAQAEEKPALLVVELDLDNMHQIRQRFPALSHYRHFVIEQLAEEIERGKK